MRVQTNDANSGLDSVIPFAPAFENAGTDRSDQLDQAGQTILQMLHNAANLAGMFCQRRNMVSPRFLGMIRDLMRFYRDAPALLELDHPGPTLGEYLKSGRYGAAWNQAIGSRIFIRNS